VAVAAEESQAAVAEENQAAVEDIKERTVILDRDINQMVVAEAIQTKEAAAEVTELEVAG
jgi:hypothetical protein